MRRIIDPEECRRQYRGLGLERAYHGSIAGAGGGAGFIGTGFHPGQVPGHLGTWINNPATITLGSGKSGLGVSNWAPTLWNKTVGAVPWVQATAANQPTYSATSFNSTKPGITLNGTSDFLTADSLAISGSRQPRLDIIALRWVGNSATQALLSMGNLANNARELTYIVSGPYRNYFCDDAPNGGDITSGLASTTNPGVLSIHNTGTYLQMFLDGVPGTKDSVNWINGVKTMSTLTLGVERDKAANPTAIFGNVTVAGIIRIAASVPLPVVKRCESWLRSKVF